MRQLDFYSHEIQKLKDTLSSEMSKYHEEKLKYKTLSKKKNIESSASQCVAQEADVTSNVTSSCYNHVTSKKIAQLKEELRYIRYTSAKANKELRKRIIQSIDLSERLLHDIKQKLHMDNASSMSEEMSQHQEKYEALSEEKNAITMQMTKLRFGINGNIESSASQCVAQEADVATMLKNTRKIQEPQEEMKSNKIAELKQKIANKRHFHKKENTELNECCLLFFLNMHKILLEQTVQGALGQDGGAGGRRRSTCASRNS